MSETCPLCSGTNCQDYYQDKARAYLQCDMCHLVFVPAALHLSLEEEKAQYDLHQNSPEDKGYRKFLSRLSAPLSKRLRPNAKGLDFGSGPGPTLSHMMEEAGHRVSLYDKFYTPGVSHPIENSEKFDFITATEVLEHLSAPGEELNKLYDCLVPGGFLGVMTKLVQNQDAFATWHYKLDPTHISFFSKDTFEWLGQSLEATVDFIGDDVIILEKKFMGHTPADIQSFRE